MRIEPLTEAKRLALQRLTPVRNTMCQILCVIAAARGSGRRSIRLPGNFQYLAVQYREIVVVAQAGSQSAEPLETRGKSFGIRRRKVFKLIREICDLLAPFVQARIGGLQSHARQRVAA